MMSASSASLASLSDPMLSEEELQALYRRAKSYAGQFPHPFIEQHQAGDLASRYRGSGLDYEESRQYQAGDEPRFINWRVTARTGEAHVKQFREETRPSVFILLDHRHTMRFGTRTRIKAAQASRLSALIAFAALQQGWSVSALRLDDDTHWFPNSSDEHGIWQFVRESAAACPPKAQGDEPSLMDVLPQLSRQLVRGSHVYLMSDFADLSTTEADNNSKADWLMLQENHPVFALQVLDPVELALPDAGKLMLQGLAGDSAQSVDLSNAEVQALFKQRTTVRQENLQKQLQGCAFYQLLSDLDNPETQFPLPHGLGT